MARLGLTPRQIRARRLAKLGGTSSPSPSKPDEDKASASEATAAAPPTRPQAANVDSEKPSPNITIQPAAAPSQPATNPSPRVVPKAGGSEGPKTSSGSLSVSRKRSASKIDDDVPAPARKPDPPQAESDEDYADRVLSQIFRISVNPHHMSNSSGHRLAFLPALNQELNDAGEPLKLSVSTLDQAIIEACSSWPGDKPLLSYLLPCWKRAVKAATSAKITAGPRFDVHEESKRLCMSNCLFALTMPILYKLVKAHIAYFTSGGVLTDLAANQTRIMILSFLTFSEL